MKTSIKNLSISIVILALFNISHAGAQTTDKVIDYYANTPARSTIPTDRATILKGKQLFAGHCSKCHKLEKQNIGPALASVTDRRPVSWLLAWIDNSQNVIGNGDKYATFLYGSYNGFVMPPFDFLSEEDKLAILSYIQDESAAPTHISGTSSGKGKN